MMKFDGFFGKRICVATSGGVDSTALLHYLKGLEKEYGFQLSAVHCEHGIRGEESKEDMRFVQELCRAWEIPLYIFCEDCLARAKRDKVSLETSAREFRLESFQELVKNGKTNFIATAHHSQDEAETVLFRIARGSSLSGAKGMEERNGFFLRPFLSWKKTEIVEYAKEHGLSWREDKTNYETDATRNKIRLQVLPALENAVGGAVENLGRFARLAGEDDEFLYRQSEKLLQKQGENFLVEFCQDAPLFRRACLLAIKGLGAERDYTFAHLNATFALQKSEKGARLDLPKGVRAEKTERGILFSIALEKEENAPPPNTEEKYSEKGFDGDRYAVKVCVSPQTEENGEWKVLRADADKIPENAVFRFRREGDTIRKFGGGKQSLKKFFNDKKIPPKERAFLPLIAERDSGEVYAVCGVEIADGIKISETTQRVVYIILQKK